jgi:predicted Zn-dependent protease
MMKHEIIHSGAKGSSHAKAKLTEEQVVEIKMLLKEGILTQVEISKMYGVGKRVISYIKTGQTWQHVKID